jgi:hypothetical protein
MSHRCVRLARMTLAAVGLFAGCGTSAPVEQSAPAKKLRLRNLQSCPP